MSASQQQELQALAESQPARRASARQLSRELVLVPQEQAARLVLERQARAALPQEQAASPRASQLPARQLQELPVWFPVARDELSLRLRRKSNSSASFSRLRQIPAAGQ
jgi:hypothetical protein